MTLSDERYRDIVAKVTTFLLTQERVTPEEVETVIEFALRQAVAEIHAWRPIETAPKDGTPILCFQPGNKKAWNENAQDPTQRVDYWATGIGYQKGFRKELPECPYTLWQPLPQPPETPK